MSNNSQKTEKQADQEKEQRTYKILAQSIKDLSFENPNDFFALSNIKSAPQISVNFNAASNKNEKNPEIFDVSLDVSVKAKHEGILIYHMELVYSSQIELIGFKNDNEIAPFLLIEVPRMMFPYVREIVSSTIIKAGFQPLFLQPIDFYKLYKDKFENKNKQQQTYVQPDVKGVTKH